MLNIKTLSILAIAGSATALPQWGSWAGKYFSGDRGDNNDAAATELEIVTVSTTVTWQGPWNGNYGGGRGNGNGRQQQTTTPVVATPTPTPSPSPSPAPFVPQQPAQPAQPAASSQAAPAAPAASSSAPVASSGSGSSSSGGYMGTVNEWRAKLGLSDLTQSDTLQANALKTAQDGNGQMKHELNPGSFAQVLAPGSADEFEKVFVGGWLCERPDMAGLDGVCTEMSKGWAYDGQTGHADILTSKSYSKIGCALATGIWACDLA